MTGRWHSPSCRIKRGCSIARVRPNRRRPGIAMRRSWRRWRSRSRGAPGRIWRSRSTTGPCRGSSGLPRPRGGGPDETGAMCWKGRGSPFLRPRHLLNPRADRRPAGRGRSASEKRMDHIYQRKGLGVPLVAHRVVPLDPKTPDVQDVEDEFLPRDLRTDARPPSCSPAAD